MMTIGGPWRVCLVVRFCLRLFFPKMADHSEHALRQERGTKETPSLATQLKNNLFFSFGNNFIWTASRPPVVLSCC